VEKPAEAPKKEGKKNNVVLIVVIALVAIAAIGAAAFFLLGKSDKPAKETPVVEEVIDQATEEVVIEEVQAEEPVAEPKEKVKPAPEQPKEEPKPEPKPEPKQEVKEQPKQEAKAKEEKKAEQKKAPAAPTVSGLRINGDLYPTVSDLNAKGGEFTAKVTLENGTASDCKVNAAGNWFTATLSPEGNLVITYMKNPTERTRSGEVEVLAGQEAVKIVFTQPALPNSVESDVWTSRIKTLLSSKSESYDNGDKYRGDLVEDVTRTGTGIYVWGDGTLYFGGWDTDLQDGKGVYSMPKGYTFASFKKCRIIVGDFDDNAPSGRIACYDAKGRLIYDGAVQGWTAAGTYPSPNPSSEKKFEYIEYSASEYYIGETLNGVRHGYGLYKTSDGTCWIGTFNNGQKVQGKAI
jgi:flagellar basal body-associated protein FliL